MKHLGSGGFKKKLLAWLLFIAFCLFYLSIGTFSGLYFGYKTDLPDVKILESYRPSLITEIYSDDNRILGEFAVERRQVISYKEIPNLLLQAIIAAEDKNFFKHPGLDITGVLRAAYRNWLAGKLVAGGSTLTQQLTRQVFLSPEKTFDRKVREFILAQEIETHFTKEQIFTLYCNVIYMGHGVYGFAAAADYYFGKNLDDLTLEEYALLACLPKAPMKYSPYINPQKALGRRNYILNRMAIEGYISKQAAELGKRQPVMLKKQHKTEIVAPYVLEMVRQHLSKRYSTKEIWSGGFRVYTTINIEIQKAANQAMADGLIEFDKRHGWRGPIMNVLSEGHEDLENFTPDDWKNKLTVGSYVTGLITSFRSRDAEVKLGDCKAVLNARAIAWTGRRSARELFQVGDLALFKINQVDNNEKSCVVSLEQIPRVEGALVAIDHTTGELKALIGGYDYTISEFNRARSFRQPGSAFKPFVYSAALEAGFEPDDMILDAPISLRGANGKIWSPNNYDKKFKGLITLRKALAESRNTATVRLASKLGVKNIIQMTRRFGINGEMDPYLAIALGSSDVTLLDLTSAYSAFPNKGVRMHPYFIRQIRTHNASIVEEHRPIPELVLKPKIAARMVELLRGVVQFGTATKARMLPVPAAGKTGTTNDYTDAWFVGFAINKEEKQSAETRAEQLNRLTAAFPPLTCGIWVGYDDKRSLGDKETAARTALPIWIKFINPLLKRSDAREAEFNLSHAH